MQTVQVCIISFGQVVSCFVQAKVHVFQAALINALPIINSLDAVTNSLQGSTNDFIHRLLKRFNHGFNSNLYCD